MQVSEYKLGTKTHLPVGGCSYANLYSEAYNMPIHGCVLCCKSLKSQQFELTFTYLSRIEASGSFFVTPTTDTKRNFILSFMCEST